MQNPSRAAKIWWGYPGARCLDVSPQNAHRLSWCWIDFWWALSLWRLSQLSDWEPGYGRVFCWARWWCFVSSCNDWGAALRSPHVSKDAGIGGWFRIDAWWDRRDLPWESWWQSQHWFNRRAISANWSGVLHMTMGAVILSSSSLCREWQMLLVGGLGHKVVDHVRDLLLGGDLCRWTKHTKGNCDERLHRNIRIHVGKILLCTADIVLESQTC